MKSQTIHILYPQLLEIYIDDKQMSMKNFLVYLITTFALRCKKAIILFCMQKITNNINSINKLL